MADEHTVEIADNQKDASLQLQAEQVREVQEDVQQMQDASARLGDLFDSLQADTESVSEMSYARGELNDSISEAQALRNEIMRESASIRQRMSAMNDLIPGMQDQLAELDGAMSEIGSVLSQLSMMLNSPTPDLQAIKMAVASLNSIKQTVDAATEAAEGEAERTNAEIKADGAYTRLEQQMEALETYQQKSRAYMNELYRESEVAQKMQQELAKSDTRFAAMTQEQQQETTMAVIATLAQGKKSAAVTAAWKSLSPEEQEATKKFAVDSYNRTEALAEQKDLNPELAEMMRKSKLLGGQLEGQRYHLADFTALLDKYEFSDKTPEEQFALLSKHRAEFEAAIRNGEIEARAIYDEARKGILVSDPKAGLLLEDAATIDIYKLYEDKTKDRFYELQAKLASGHELTEAEQKERAQGLAVIASEGNLAKAQLMKYAEQELGIAKGLVEELERDPARAQEIIAGGDPKYAELSSFINMSDAQKIDTLVEKNIMTKDQAVMMNGILDEMNRDMKDLSEGERKTAQLEMLARYTVIGQEAANIPEAQRQAFVNQQMDAMAVTVNQKYGTKLPENAQDRMLSAGQLLNNTALNIQRQKAENTLHNKLSPDDREMILNLTAGRLSSESVQLLNAYEAASDADKPAIMEQLQNHVSSSTTVASDMYYESGKNLLLDAKRDSILAKALEAEKQAGYEEAKKTNPELTLAEYSKTYDENNTFIQGKAYTSLPDRDVVDQATARINEAYEKGREPSAADLQLYAAGKYRETIDRSSALTNTQQFVKSLPEEQYAKLRAMDERSLTSYLTANGIIPASNAQNSGGEDIKNILLNSSKEDRALMLDTLRASEGTKESIQQVRNVQEAILIGHGNNSAIDRRDDLLKEQALTTAYANMSTADIRATSQFGMQGYTESEFETVLTPEAKAESLYHANRYDFYLDLEMTKAKRNNPSLPETEITRLAEQQLLKKSYLNDTTEIIYPQKQEARAQTLRTEIAAANPALSEMEIESEVVLQIGTTTKYTQLQEAKAAQSTPQAEHALTQQAAAITTFQENPARYAKAYAAGDKAHPDYKAYVAANDALYYAEMARLEAAGTIDGSFGLAEEAATKQMHTMVEQAYAQEEQRKKEEELEATNQQKTNAELQAKAVGVSIAGAGVTYNEEAAAAKTAANSNEPATEKSGEAKAGTEEKAKAEATAAVGDAPKAEAKDVTPEEKTAEAAPAKTPAEPVKKDAAGRVAGGV
ncbi:MAG: hypothetical protein CMM93_03405 [Rickettsiales bacterium]|nr:hypothetical protein [Rickettsiales bacterium]